MLSLLRRVFCLSLACAGCGESAPEPPALEVGGLEAVEAALSAQRGRGCLLNFWATWCPPCVAELPDLLAVAREYEQRGGSVLGVSYDLMVGGKEPAQVLDGVRAFLGERELALPTVIYDAPDFASIDARFDLPGAIPVTLAFDRTGQLVDRHEGEATRERFAAMMQRALGP